MFTTNKSKPVKKVTSLMLALVMIISMLPATVFGAVSAGFDLSVNNITTDSFQIKIKLDNFDYYDYHEIKIKVYEDIRGNQVFSDTINNTQNANHTITVTNNVYGDTKYRVEVDARYSYDDDNKSGSYSDSTTFTTKSSATINNVSISKSTGSTATAQFYYKLNSDIKSYKTGIVYTTNSNNEPTINNYTGIEYGSKNYNSDTVEVTFNNLSNTTYYLRGFVQYYDANGNLQTVYSDQKHAYTHSKSNSSNATIDEIDLIQSYGSTAKFNFYYDLDNGLYPENAGIVYTTSSSVNPTLDNKDGVVYGNPGKNSYGNLDVTLDGLYNTTYYVRSFVEYKDSNNRTQVEYSNSKYKHDHTSSDTPNVSTTRVKLEDYEIYALGEIYDEGRYSVTDYGFVCTYDSTKMPTLESNQGKVSGEYRTNRKDTFEGYLPVTSTGTCYIRAYAKNSAGTSYGELMEVSLKNAAATVDLVSVSGVTADSVMAKINVPSKNSLTILERGVILSRWTKSPEYEGHNVVKVMADPVGQPKTGEATITVDGLEKDTEYHIRAYVKTANLGVIYSSAEGQSFTTTKENFISTKEIKNVTQTSAEVVCNIVKDLPYAVLERGVVYSAVNSTPTVSNSLNITDGENVVGDFSIPLTNLDKNKTYYARGYVRTIDGYEYGAVRSFNTSQTTTSEATINVTYKTANETTVGTQKINASIGSTLDSNSLNLPTGYILESSGFRYTVSGSDSIIIVVTSATNPIPAPTPGIETAFAQGVGNYKFNPDVAMTRIDVVKMLYNLLGGGQQYPASKTFTDVPAGLDGTEAINFATYKGYISGYEDGTFRPNNGITRAELTVIVCKAFELMPNNSSSVTLTDISSHWGISYIMLCVQNGVISGYEDKTFKPDRQVSRAEAVTIFSNVSGRSLKPLGTQEFTDVPKSHWAYNYIMNAAVPTP